MLREDTVDIQVKRKCCDVESGHCVESDTSAEEVLQC